MAKKKIKVVAFYELEGLNAKQVASGKELVKEGVKDIIYGVMEDLNLEGKIISVK